MNLEGAFRAARIMNKAEFPESVHKEAHTRTSRPDHLGKRFLADPGNHGFRDAFLSKVSEQEQHASQTLFARVEKLVNKILFVTYIPRQQVRHEHFRECGFTMKSVHHDLLLYSENLTICHGRGRAHS